MRLITGDYSGYFVICLSISIVGVLVILQDERVEHARTKTVLVNEEEKLQFANREIEILKKQLEREKATFERAYVCVHSKVSPGIFISCGGPCMSYIHTCIVTIVCAPCKSLLASESHFRILASIPS